MKSFFIHSFRNAFLPASARLRAFFFSIGKPDENTKNTDLYLRVEAFGAPFKHFEQARSFSLE